MIIIAGEDEEWSDSEKTPSVSSGVEGGGSAVSSPTGQLVDEELVALQPPPPRLNQVLGPDDIRLRLSVLPTSDDARKRLAAIADDLEVSTRVYCFNIVCIKLVIRTNISEIRTYHASEVFLYKIKTYRWDI